MAQSDVSRWERAYNTYGIKQPDDEVTKQRAGPQAGMGAQAQTAHPLPGNQANNIQPEYESQPPFHPVAAIQRVIFNGKPHCLVPEDEYLRHHERGIAAIDAVHARARAEVERDGTRADIEAARDKAMELRNMLGGVLARLR